MENLIVDGIKLVKKGFFFKDYDYDYLWFYSYDEVEAISPLFKEYGISKFLINFLKRKQLVLKDKNHEKLSETYNQIVNGWLNYHSQDFQDSQDSIFKGVEKKLDALLNHIEIMPGGEEYEKAKNNSESKISFNSN